MRGLAGDLGISADQIADFRKAVKALLQEGQVVLGMADTIALPPPGKEMIGRFRLAQRGFGFVIPETPADHGDLFIPPDSTGGALTGDRVRARVLREQHRTKRRGGPARSPFVGRIDEILHRSDQQYVGNLFKQGGSWYVQVDGYSLHDPVVIRDPHAKNAKAGDKVAIELIGYPDDDELGEGVIVEVLGPQGEPHVETAAVIRAFALAGKFSDIVLNEARKVTRAFDENHAPADREDLRNTLCLTIDPPDAKDFDDAISLRRIDEAPVVYELGIHIADVAHFVGRETALDEESRQRGNSAYLPQCVIPMLPEILSNGVCSLQEGANRYCKSVFIRYDAKGKVVSQRHCRSVIRSKKRFTYREAQAVIDDDLKAARKHAKTDPKYPPAVTMALRHMDELAKIIRRRRLKAGMIVLNLPEVELIYNDSGRVIDAVPEDSAFTHTLIEMFMVEANEAVARLFDGLDVAMIRRIHPDPDAVDLGELRQFARVAGHNVPARPSRSELQQLLEAVRDKPQERAVHLAVLKTLSKAEYAPLRVGHFALASEHYSHFTSPIRRYSDLVVHRALDAYHDHAQSRGGRRKGKRAEAILADPRCPDEPTLARISRHCSFTERNAESAERDLRTYLVLELLTEHLGEDFESTVTGVTVQGMYVQLDRFLVDGFIRTSDFGTEPGDRWRLHPQTGALQAQRSRRTITIGDRLKVQIAKVDPPRRQLDLVMIQSSMRPAARRRQSEGASKAHQDTQKTKKTKKTARKDRRSSRITK